MPMLFEFIADPVHVTGHVTAAGTGAPIAARVERVEFEAGFVDDEARFADAVHGRFHAWLPDGTWTLRFSADGFQVRARHAQHGTCSTARAARAAHDSGGDRLVAPPAPICLARMLHVSPPMTISLFNKLEQHCYNRPWRPR